MSALSSDPPQARPAQAAAAPAARVRDIRLDFYRGIAMFIILMAHIPYNTFTNWIPARFGFSDATEIFVFCSGMASAIAFGRVFADRGWGMGALRISYRVWQVYWAHIGLFFAVAMTLAALDATGLFERDYIGDLNLYPFFVDNTQQQLIGLMTLRYVPNYFDILPMYLVILAMIPLMMGLARIHPYLALGASAAIWLVTQTGALSLPAEPWTDREWFFNPFGWQLIFFTGFAFIRGWLPAPPVRKDLVLLAVLLLLVTIPFARWQIFIHVDWIKDWRADYRVLIAKTDFGLLRYVHFLLLAYVFWVLAGPGGSHIRAHGTGLAARAWGFVLKCILKVGQQSLAVFITSMWLARVLGAWLDVIGRTTPNFWLVNLTGMALITLTAFGVAWIKGQPWRKPA
ncbi:OpgC family protein [Meridianimarinicoccus sp. MJW13]|uniref:OpgC family protein n=1 Tax=Meridianimarinicoccus sp. MJW13 TaxID=2720031 RepID=UPI001865B61A|nr:OpgC domain-containing protein [Fluviibacterium sp. MJW13]